MITINKHTNYSDYFDQFNELYLSYFESSSEPKLPTYSYQTKLNTPLIVTSLITDLIPESLIPKFRESMFYLGYLHSIVPNATKVHSQNEFKRMNGTYLIPHSYFITNEIVYADNEFGHIATKQSKPKISNKNFTRNQKYSLQKLYEICFSASSFRYMLIKAECMTFMYFYLFSLGDKNNDILSFYGCFDYALSKASEFKDSPITYGIIYVWELVTAFNHFSKNSLPIQNDSELNLPLHHVYKYPRHLYSISAFGDYDLSSCNYKLNLPDIEFLNHYSITPKTSTSIPASDKTLYYLPYEIDPQKVLSSSFNNFLDYFFPPDTIDLYELFEQLKLINEFENSFVISSELPQTIDGEFFVKSVEDAKELIKEKDIKLIDGYDIYASVMIKDNVSKKIINIKLE